MNYRLCDIMELLDVNRIHPSDNDIAEILNSYSELELINLALIFLRGIGNRHQVPGKVVDVITGITQFHKQADLLTNKQRFYLFHNILNHWNQINIQTRVDLML